MTFRIHKVKYFLKEASENQLLQRNSTRFSQHIISSKPQALNSCCLDLSKTRLFIIKPHQCRIYRVILLVSIMDVHYFLSAELSYNSLNLKLQVLLWQKFVMCNSRERRDCRSAMQRVWQEIHLTDTTISQPFVHLTIHPPSVSQSSKQFLHRHKRDTL